MYPICYIILLPSSYNLCNSCLKECSVTTVIRQRCISGYIWIKCVSPTAWCHIKFCSMKAVKMHIIKNFLYLHVKNLVKLIGKLGYETSRNVKIRWVLWFLQSSVPLITLMIYAHVDMWMYSNKWYQVDWFGPETGKNRIMNKKCVHYFYRITSFPWPYLPRTRAVPVSPLPCWCTSTSKISTTMSHSSTTRATPGRCWRTLLLVRLYSLYRPQT